MTQMELLLRDYYTNEGEKLHRMVIQILSKFGGLYEKDLDDFYSIANEVMVDVCHSYDTSQNFEVYLWSCLSNRIKTEITRRNREKRRADRISISMDTGLGGDSKNPISDTLASNFDIDVEAGVALDERVVLYLDTLTDIQRKIAIMIMYGYKAVDIKRQLQLTDSQYMLLWRDMRTFEKTRAFWHTETIGNGEDNIMNQTNTQTLEKSKPDRVSISSIIKRMDKCTVRFDHPLQRESEQWSSYMKGNLISDILQGNPVPPLVFAEQVIDGIAIIWNLDGKQRCTNAYMFWHDGYKIAKNVRRYIVSYQALERDRAGNPQLDIKGFPIHTRRDIDIRGKKISDLPEELQDKFLEYNFEVVQFLNCSSDDIAYHIARYNEGKPMTVSQRGMTRLGESFAATIKRISGLDFFKEVGNYKPSELQNGTINRVVVESVMVINFLEDWKKRQEDMCEYINTHATIGHFRAFEELVNRILKAGNKDIFAMFNSRDSFLWFGLFARFTDIGLKDEKFIAFMQKFSESLHGKMIEGFSYDELNQKSTKDKSVVIAKLGHLHRLMEGYLV